MMLILITFTTVLLHAYFLIRRTLALDDHSTLSFQVTSGDNDNFFFRDNFTSAQIVLTRPNSSSPIRRFITALPAGNAGALVYFSPLSQNENLVVALVNNSITSTTRDFGNAGIQADLAFSDNATLGATIVGAVRAMRGACITRCRVENKNKLTSFRPC